MNNAESSKTLRAVHKTNPGIKSYEFIYQATSRMRRQDKIIKNIMLLWRTNRL